MDNNPKISPETQQLVGLFSSIEDVEIIPWIDGSEAVGFSLLKDYPDKGLFLPARNKKGEKDSIAMIRVWYLTRELIQAEDKKKVRLSVAIIKSSRYLFKHHFYEFENEDSPTKVSLAESKASRQPVDFEDFSRYEFLIDEKRIHDLKKNKYIEPEDVVNQVYKLHLNLITNIPFQIVAFSQKKLIESIDPTNNFLKKVNLYIFGRRIKKTKDFGAGIITPYPLDSLEDSLPSEAKAKILGSDFPISFRTAGTFIVFFSIVYLIKYIWHYDFLGIVALMNSTTNAFFLAILTGGMLLLFDRVIPYSILLLINLLIRFQWFLISLKIKV